MPDPIRLLVGITLAEMGGAQKVTVELLRGLSETDYDITVVSAPDGCLWDWIAAMNRQRSRPIKVHPLSVIKRSVSPLHDAAALYHLVRLLRHGQYDVAHFHSSKMGLLGRLAAAICGIPAIYTAHGWGIHAAQSKFSRWAFYNLERVGGWLASEVVCVCHADRDFGLAHGFLRRPKSQVIYNGIPEAPIADNSLHRILGLKKTIPIIGVVGRLVYAKHPELAIATAAELKARGVEEFRMVMIGDGPLFSACEALVKEWELTENVIFMGARDDAASLSRSFWVQLLLSRYEGFPLVLLEAMQAGIPVVATPVGGVPEQVDHGATGYLVQPEPAAAAEAVEKIIRDSALRERFSHHAARKFERFAVEEMVGKYDLLYKRVNRRSQGGADYATLHRNTAGSRAD